MVALEAKGWTRPGHRDKAEVTCEEGHWLSEQWIRPRGLCWALEEGTRRLGTEKQVMQLQGDPQLELDTHLERQ